MAATEEMLAIALRHRPHAACIVPERREERTTEGGLDAAGGYHHLRPFVDSLSAAGSRVSLFIEPDPLQLEAAAKLGAPVVELHTGAYCDAYLEAPDRKSVGEGKSVSVGVDNGGRRIMKKKKRIVQRQ